MKSGIELIADERRRQVEEEGWTEDHDRAQRFQHLALAGACYANLASKEHPEKEPLEPTQWPWSYMWWKPKSHLRNLVRAGALIAAAIDRLQSKGE